MSTYDDLQPAFDQLRKAIADAIDARPGVEQPHPEPEKPEEQVILSITLPQGSSGEWDNGFSNQKPRITVPDDDPKAATKINRNAFSAGNKLQIPGVGIREITGATYSHNRIWVDYSGPKIDGKLLADQQIQVLKGSAAPQPEQPAPGKPEAPVEHPKGSLPIAGLCVAGMGNNPALAAINGLGRDTIGTHYRDVEETTIREFVKDLKPGESWIARIDIALERFIDNSNMPLNEKYVKEVLRAMDLLHKYKGRVILDVHNYMRLWKKVAQPVAGRENASFDNHLAKGHAVWTIIGAPDCPITAAGFADFWKRMAQTFKDHPALLGYGLSNEPHKIKTDNVDVHATWPGIAQGCINSIRTTDKNTFIMVGGNFWSSAKMWESQSAALGKLKDPSDRIVFEAHQYMDKEGDGGGRWASQTDPVAADQGVKDWDRWFKWLEAGNHMGYCGEVGGPATAGDLNKALENLYAEFYKRRIPWTQWRAGAGFQDNDANGMNRKDGSLKDNAKPIMKYLGKTVDSYGPRK